MLSKLLDLMAVYARTMSIPLYDIYDLVKKLSFVLGIRQLHAKSIKDLINLLQELFSNYRFSRVGTTIRVYYGYVDYVYGVLFYEKTKEDYIIKDAKICARTYSCLLPKGYVRRLCREGKVECYRIRYRQSENKFYYLVNVLDLLKYCTEHIDEVEKAVNRSIKRKYREILRRQIIEERCRTLVEHGVYSSIYKCLLDEERVLNDNYYKTTLENAKRLAEELKTLYESMSLYDKLMVLCQLFSKYAKLDPSLYFYKEQIIKKLLEECPEKLKVQYLVADGEDDYYDLFEITLNAEKKLPLLSYVVHIPAPRARALGIYRKLNEMVSIRRPRDQYKYGSPPNGILKVVFPLEYIIEEYNKLINSKA